MYTSRWRSTGKRRGRHRGIANYEMCEAFFFVSRYICRDISSTISKVLASGLG